MDSSISKSRTRRIGRGQIEDRARPSMSSRAPGESPSPEQPAVPSKNSPPLHPRHPRASMSGPEATQQVDPRHESAPRRLAPPVPPESDEIMRVSPISDDDDWRFDDESRDISRPSMEQHWPLSAPSAPRPMPPDPVAPPLVPPPEPPRVPPQRPPRPDHGLSQEDISYLEDTTPSFRPPAPAAVKPQEPEPRVEQQPARRPARYVAFPLSTPHQVDSISEIPEEPAPSKRVSVMGPPPSSRRGWSTFYNTTTAAVSPIVEELASNGSRASGASSGVMPDFIYGNSGGYEASHEEWSRAGHVHHQGLAPGFEHVDIHPASPVEHHDMRSLSPHNNPFHSDNSFIERSANPSITPTQERSPDANAGLLALDPAHNTRANTFGSSVASDSEDWQEASGSPEPLTRPQGAAKRPPKLDMEAIRAAEARGSLTSLPDLILRATRLAALIESGKRPSSRHGELDFTHDKSVLQNGSHSSNRNGRSSSDISNLPSTYPQPGLPPGKTNYRNSLFLRVGGNGSKEGSANAGTDGPSKKRKREPRRCCGLPPWAAVLLFLLILAVIVVAVVVPVELLVVKKHQSKSDIQKCEESLICLHGGINVLLEDSCSCICTNGFSGVGCEIQGSRGCVTSNLIATDGSSRINNATLGSAVPRVISDAPGNYSIALSATVILARLNSANVSCIAQNSLLTFDHEDTRIGAGDDPVGADGPISTDGKAAAANQRRGSLQDLLPRYLSRLGGVVGRKKKRVAPRSSQASASVSSQPMSSSTFVVTESVLDFARTAVLYVLQQESFEAATTAHDWLQDFFDQAAAGLTDANSTVTVQQATNLKIGNTSSVDLVSATVNFGQTSPGQVKIPMLSGVSELAVLAGAV